MIHEPPGGREEGGECFSDLKLKCERNTFPKKQTLDCVQLVHEYPDKARAEVLV